VRVFPNAFIIGAPRSGTTALWRYLSKTPGVYTAPIKEPHYFAPDIYRSRLTEREYLGLFRGVKLTDRVVLEGSVSYLYSRNALRAILDRCPEAKFIVLVRDPVDMVVSMHARMLLAGWVDVESFEEAWKMQREPQKNCPAPFFLKYKEVGRIGTYLVRAMREVGEDRLKVLTFDELVARPQRVYRSVCEFLGVKAFEGVEFKIYNERRMPRASALSRTMAALGPVVKKAIARAPKVLQRGMVSMSDVFVRAISVRLKKEGQAVLVSGSILEEMEKMFASELQILEEITGGPLRRRVRGG